jgi:hypothetical protein
MPSFRHLSEGSVLKDGEKDFRFTIFCGRSRKKWARMLASNPWRCIELELSDQKLAEARAFLAQARDFFAAAAGSGWTSRPLLLHYGFVIRCCYLGTSDLPLHISERVRTKTTILDAHNVNMSSTALA